MATYLFDIPVEDILQPGKSPRRSRARSVFCYWAVRELDHTANSIALYLGLTQPAISKAVARGKRLVKKLDLHLEGRKE